MASSTFEKAAELGDLFVDFEVTAEAMPASGIAELAEPGILELLPGPDATQSHSTEETEEARPATDLGTQESLHNSVPDRLLSTQEKPESCVATHEPPQAMFMFVIGEDRFADSVEIGVLIERPEALKTITSNESLTTSAFLRPAIQAAMAELQPSLLAQVAVHLTIISFRLVSEILASVSDGQTAEYRNFSSTVRNELDRTLPYFDWQGQRNCCGRARYAMVMLEEAVRTLGIESHSLVQGLSLNTEAQRTMQSVTQAIAAMDLSFDEVCGLWAAENLLSAWPFEKAKPKRQRNESKVLQSPFVPLHEGAFRQWQDTPLDKECDREDLLERNGLARVKRKKISPQTRPSSGERKDDPFLISDSDYDANNDKKSVSRKTKSRKTGEEPTRSSDRDAAHKSVDYNMDRHPQDDQICFATRRGRATKGSQAR